MDVIQHIIIDHTLARIGDAAFADYLCHAYCYGGYCTFERNEQSFRFEAGDCMIIDFFDFHAQLYGADKISSQQHQLMEQFIEMLERGDYRKNRDISYYADQLCVTTKYLSEVSKKVSGLPAAFWITRYASLDISRLLRNRRLSFTDISDMFGFTSLSHFSRYVQTNLGAKPSDFRE